MVNAMESEVSKLYEKLKSDLLTQDTVGEISITLADVSCTIKGKDAVGHMLQEWVLSWCEDKGFSIESNSNTQEFPDYFLLGQGGVSYPVEIKCFDINKTPAFDVADFHAFVDDLENDIKKLDADYIVFGYSLVDGELKVSEIWKKKIWELVGKSTANWVTTQIRGKKCSTSNRLPVSAENIDKKGRILKFRPYNFKVEESDNKFESPIEFLENCQKLLSYSESTMDTHSDWLEKIKNKLN